jgi:uncharacterized cupin superfamily protein
VTLKTFNLFHGETQAVPEGAPGDRGKAARVRPIIGGSRLGMSVYDLPPGEAIGPYHYEWTDEEWLLVIAGVVTVRTASGEQELAPGDLTCFPTGPEGAHQVRNAGGETARVAIVSTMNEFGIVEYPELEQVGIWAGPEHFVLGKPATT